MLVLPFSWLWFHLILKLPHYIPSIVVLLVDLAFFEYCAREKYGFDSYNALLQATHLHLWEWQAKHLMHNITILYKRRMALRNRTAAHFDEFWSARQNQKRVLRTANYLFFTLFLRQTS